MTHEVPVVGGDNCVLLPLLDVLSARSEDRVRDVWLHHLAHSA